MDDRAYMNEVFLRLFLPSVKNVRALIKFKTISLFNHVCPHLYSRRPPHALKAN